MSKLVTLRMSSNMLEGTVPTSWGSQLKYLQILDLSRNWLIGDVLRIPEVMPTIPSFAVLTHTCALLTTLLAHEDGGPLSEEAMVVILQERMASSSPRVMALLRKLQ